MAIEREAFHFTEVWSDADGEFFTADFITWHPFPPGYPVQDFMEGRHLPCVLGRPVAVQGVRRVGLDRWEWHEYGSFTGTGLDGSDWLSKDSIHWSRA